MSGMKGKATGRTDGGRGAMLAAEAARLNRWYFATHPDRPRVDVVERPAALHACARCGWQWRTLADAPAPRACPRCRARKWQEPKPPRISDTARHCRICGYSWKARKRSRPCSCPRCNSPYWDAPENMMRKPRTAYHAENAENAK